MDDPDGANDTTTQRKVPPAPIQQQAAQYIADLSRLRVMAAGAGMPFLAHLLEMVMQEAFEQGEMPRTAPYRPTRKKLPAVRPRARWL